LLIVVVVVYAVMLVGFVARYFLYRKGLARFKAGARDLDWRYYDRVCLQIPLEEESIAKGWPTVLESAMKRERMMFVRRNRSFCSFTPLIMSSVQLMLLINPIITAGVETSICFDFRDCFRNPVMAESNRWKYLKKIYRLFAHFETALAQAVAEDRTRQEPSEQIGVNPQSNAQG